MITFKNVLGLAKSGAVYYDTPLYSKDSAYRMLKSNVSFLLSNNRILCIENGFYWDESSIPYLLQWAFPKSGKYAVASLVHDALYSYTQTSQKFADNEFKQWMIALEISKFQIWFRYNTVRKLGGFWWKKRLNHPDIRVLRNRELITLV